GITQLDLSATEQLSWVEGNYVFAEGDFSMANGNQKIFGDVALSLKAVLPENISGLGIPEATFNEYDVAMEQTTTIQFSDVVVEQAIQEASNAQSLEV
ncbi:MAG TPA: hypothetical protein VFP93_02880, partial [Gammaproteobacteria bacterium]|nr:hypothetical protein [Gammaproteobacteria bacterium]